MFSNIKVAIAAGGESVLQIPALSGDGVEGLIGRLRRSLHADCVGIVEIDAGTARTQIVGVYGVPTNIAAFEAAAGSLAQLIPDGGLVTHTASGIDVRITRFELPRSGVGAMTMSFAIDRHSDFVIVATRHRGAPLFTVNDERAARRLAEWIADHVRLWSMLRHDRERGNGLRAGLDGIGAAVCILDHAGKLVEVNRAARLLLERGNGLRIVDDMLTATRLDESARLQTAIAHARSGHDDGGRNRRATVLAVSRDGQRPLAVAVLRVDPPLASAECGVVVQLVDPDADLSRPMMPICALYRFTSAEARLVKLIVMGLSLAEAATQLNIQPPTARTYLKQVFAKTGTNRQAGLVQLMLTSLIRAGPDVELVAF